MKDSSTIREVLNLEGYYIKKYTKNNLLNTEMIPGSGFHLPAFVSGITLLWVKLSNSGDFLKLIVLSYIRKNLSG
jgi:hypothetical protein